jgi:multidrug efflux pump subunit AcrB
MKRLVSIAVHNPVFVNILLALFLIAGGASATLMIREMFPAFSLDMVLVQVPYPGAGPEEVEEGVCIKLEEAIEGTPGIKNYVATAQDNMGVLRIEVASDADVSEVKEDVTDRVNSIVTFPVDAEDPIVSEIKIDTRILSIAVFGEAGERQLKELGERVKDDLLQRGGISQVNVSGARTYEISIEISETALRRYGLTFDQVSRAVREASQNFPGGTLRGDHEQIKIRSVDRRYTGRDYAGIILLTDPSGASIRLDQVAGIHDGFTDDRLIARFNGQPAVMVDINKTRTEDALRISGAVDQVIEEYNAKLPANVRLKKFFDASRFINERLALLINNGSIGLIIVFCLLWLFLDLRLAFWCSMGIPISLAGALALMGATGQSINMISLFAMIMILGIIVDDAIVVGESIYHQRRQGLPPLRAAVEGTVEVAWPVFGAVSTTIIAFVPMLFVEGIMGKFIRVLPMAVICALVVSFVEVVIMLPAHLRGLPEPHAPKPTHHPWLRRLRGWRRAFGEGLEEFAQRRYAPVIRWVLAWRYAAVAAAVAILLIAIGGFRGGVIKYELFPEVDTELVFAQVEFPIGTPVEQTETALKQMRDALFAESDAFERERGAPLVEGVYSVAGQAFGPNVTEVAGGTHLGLLLVETMPTAERNLHFRKILADWEARVGPIPGAVSAVYDVPEMGPGGKAIEIALLGNDIEQLKLATVEMREQLGGYRGVFQVDDDFRDGKLELRPKIKPEARNLGLSAADIGRQIRQAFYGDESLRVQRGSDDVKVWIRYPRDERKTIEDVRRLRIRTDDGREIPLSAAADLQLRPGTYTIHRKNGLRRINMTANVNNEVTNAKEVIEDLQTAFVPDLLLRHPSVRVSFEGQSQESSDSLGSLLVGFPLAMLAIYLLLATMFRSYVQPLVIMVTIPFGLIGAVIGHLVMGFHVTMLSLFGMVALAGIVVNDAIVLIDAVNDRVRRGVPVRESLCLGGMRRFRAIVLTTLTTSGGLAPLIMEKSMQAQFLIPMAISISFGVAFATLLTLLIIPSMLLILNDARRMVHWIWTGRWPTREEVEPIAQIPPEERPHVPATDLEGASQ